MSMLGMQGTVSPEKWRVEPSKDQTKVFELLRLFVFCRLVFIVFAVYTIFRFEM